MKCIRLYRNEELRLAIGLIEPRKELMIRQKSASIGGNALASLSLIVDFLRKRTVPWSRRTD